VGSSQNRRRIGGRRSKEESMSRRFLTIKDRKAIQQPLNKDGYSDNDFTKLYGKDKNPYLGTERDRKNKKNISTETSEAYEKGWDYIFGNKNEHK